jgi:hypothetical protein
MSSLHGLSGDEAIMSELFFTKVYFNDVQEIASLGSARFVSLLKLMMVSSE